MASVRAKASAAPEVLAPISKTKLELVAPDARPVAADWEPTTSTFFASATGQGLLEFLAHRVEQGATIYPPQPLRALQLTPLALVRVVILGQDPYHGPGQAEGLAFSVPDGLAAPPSLRNIRKELQRDLGAELPKSPSLLPWARQGVLLLNSCLTVEDGRPASHAGQGWEVFTDQVIAAVARRNAPCVYMLWGVHAQKKAALIEQSAAPHRWLILQANHPSPLSATRGPTPFIGCGHFSTAAAWLRERGQEFDWAGSG